MPWYWRPCFLVLFCFFPSFPGLLWPSDSDRRRGTRATARSGARSRERIDSFKAKTKTVVTNTCHLSGSPLCCSVFFGRLHTTSCWEWSSLWQRERYPEPERESARLEKSLQRVYMRRKTSYGFPITHSWNQIFRTDRFITQGSYTYRQQIFKDPSRTFSSYRMDFQPPAPLKFSTRLYFMHPFLSHVKNWVG